MTTPHTAEALAKEMWAYGQTTMNRWALDGAVLIRSQAAEIELMKAEQAKAAMQADTEVHMSHCNQGDHVGSCKYGEDDCPALPMPQAKATDVKLEALAKRDISDMEQGSTYFRGLGWNEAIESAQQAVAAARSQGAEDERKRKTCPTCEALARTVMMDQTGKA